MHESVRDFLKDNQNPPILFEYYEDVYNYYCLQTLIKGKYKPISRNKFSRDIGKWGFKTDVCRDYQDEGKCKRIIILPEPLLARVIIKLKHDGLMRNVTDFKEE